MSSTENSSSTAMERLDLYIDSARQQFDAESIEHAARRLCTKLSLTGPVQRPTLGSLLKNAFSRAIGWTSLAGTAALLVIVLSFALVLVPQSNGTALAQAQQWFTTFHTLQVEAAVVEGDTTTDVLTWFDESGATRIESGGATTIIRPDEGMIYVLRPDGGRFAQRIVPDMALVESPAGFMNVVQSFMDADRLAESRVINGVPAIGYRRETNEWSIVLWLDPSDGRPLLVEQKNANGVTIHSVLSFNVPLPADAFAIPDEVVLLEPRQ